MALAYTAVFFAGFLPTLLSLHRRWSSFDEAYSHGYLLLALALYLFWQISPQSTSRQPGPHQSTSQQRDSSTAPQLLQYGCIAVIAATSLGWLLFLLAGITALQQLMLPVLALCGAGAIGGSMAFKRATVPCGLIYLGIPVWDELLTTPLQTLSTAVSGWTIGHAFGIPVSIDGFHIRVPAGTFEIQGGCSGLVFLLTALTLGIAYGQLFLHTLRARAICVLIAATLGVIVNWIRIISLILIGHYTEMRSPLIGEGHLMFGFYIFGGMSLVVIFIASRMATRGPAGAAAMNAWAPPAPTRNAVLALVALVLGPLTLLLLRGTEPATMSLTAPATIGTSLVSAAATQPGWRPDFPGALIAARYNVTQDRAIDVDIVYYANQFGTGKLVSQLNRPLPVSWKTRQRSTISLANGVNVLETHAVDDQGQALLVWSWYTVGEDIVATESAARLAQLRNAVHLCLDGSFTSMATRCIFADCALSAGALQRHSMQVLTDVSQWTATLRNNQ